MIKLIRILKWCLLFVGVGWATYSGNAFIFLARTFLTPRSVKYGLSEILANLQGYAVVFGPVIIAVIFLMIRWPESPRRAQ
jgi:hypothetical protein